MRRHAPLVLLLACACTGPEVSDDTDVAAGPATLTLSGERVTQVGVPVALAPEALSGAHSAEWTFGDGARAAADAEGRATHTYEAPGHYVATLAVTGADGALVTASVAVVVTWPVLAAVPRSSGSVAAGSGRAFVAMEDFDAVAAIDRARWAVSGHVDTCPQPRWLSYLPDAVAPESEGTLVVACRETRPGLAFFAVDGDGIVAGATLDLTGTGRAPTGVVLADDGTAWATVVGRGDDVGALLHVDRDGVILDEVTLGPDPRGLAIQGDQLVVTRFRSADAGGEGWRVDAATLAVTPFHVAVAPGPDSDTDAAGVPSYLGAIAIRPDGRAFTVAGLKANVARGLFRSGVALTDETTTRADLRQLPLVGGDDAERPRLDNLDMFAAVAYAPRGDRLYALTYGTRTVQVLDAYTLVAAGSIDEVGIAPDGLALTADGSTLLVHGAASRVLSVIEAVPPFVRLAEVDLVPITGEVLAPDVLRGKQVFSDSSDQRMSRFGYTSCASCHFEGDDDGRTWDFTDRGEGVRNTISLRGMAERAGGPIHWSGNFDEVQDFEADIRGPQAGHGFLADALWTGDAGPTLGAPKAGLSADLDALAAYVESLGVPDVPWDADVSAGRALFESAHLGCATCHPAGGTVSGWLSPGVPDLRDVGTLSDASGHRLGGELTGIDPPSLRGVWASAPYLHDGSAATLADVVTARNLDDEHGVVTGLSSGELADLVAYLRSL